MLAPSPLLSALSTFPANAGAAASTDGAGLLWIWVGVGLAVVALAVVIVILLRAGRELQEGIRLVVTRGELRDKTIAITSAYTTIGSGTDNDVVVGDDKVSQHHARLVFRKGKLRIIDANSLYGTFLNGERVDAAVCSLGDILCLGPNFECRIEIDSG